jgi:hypothetical protein
MANGDQNAAQDWVARRRKRLATYVEIDNINGPFSAADKPERIGLAFSGRGIRSATISLGITPSLVRRNRFSAFDYVSTASGGGYFGCGCLFGDGPPDQPDCGFGSDIR